MPSFRPSPDLEMHYVVDDFTDPWTQPETVLMLHGNAESGLAWWAWVPTLARHYRVVRPDMRGFGQSTPMPKLTSLMNALNWAVNAVRALRRFSSVWDRG